MIGWKKNVMAVVLLSLVGLFALTGCDQGTKIDAANAGPGMYDILARHDAYVNADASLSPTQKTIYLRSSALVKNMLDTALKAVKPATSTATSTATGVSMGTDIGPAHNDYGKMIAVEKLAYKLRKDQCRKEGMKLEYKEFHNSGPYAIDYNSVHEIADDHQLAGSSTWITKNQLLGECTSEHCIMVDHGQWRDLGPEPDVVIGSATNAARSIGKVGTIRTIDPTMAGELIEPPKDVTK